MANYPTEDAPVVCSFCGKSQAQIDKLIAGPGVYICNECVDLCVDILDEERGAEGASASAVEPLRPAFHGRLPSPAELKRKLDDFVIGQDAAKIALSVAVYNHYKRINHIGDRTAARVEIQKSNVLLLGPTGVGKTMLAQTLAKILDVPFAIADATTLTEAGYVGEDVENILLRLIQAADHDMERAERGIIYIDELDKIARKSENPSITRDVSGEGVQQALLKILEGTLASVPPRGGRKHPGDEFLQIDTGNILFICGGAFAGIEKVIEHRIGGSSMGFGAPIKNKAKDQYDNMIQQVIHQDLVRFGLIPELVGRLPVIAALEELGEDALVRILSEPRNALLRQYKQLFAYDDVDLEIDRDALVAIAQKTLEKDTGARGLRAAMEELLLPLMYDIPSDPSVERVVITGSCVTDNAEPQIERNPARLNKVRRGSAPPAA